MILGVCAECRLVVVMVVFSSLISRDRVDI